MVNPSPPHHRDHKQFLLLLLLLLLFPTGGKKEREEVAVAFWGGRLRSGRPQRLPLPPPPPPNIRDPFSKKISPLTHDTTTLPFKITDISPFFFQTPEMSFRTRAPPKTGVEKWRVLGANNGIPLLTPPHLQLPLFIQPRTPNPLNAPLQ